jgi:polar amino acid transport system substrate-binding protein
MRILAALLVFWLSAPALAEERIIRLAAIEWQPYASASVAQQGSISATLKLAFAAVGHSLQIEFMSRRQALRQAARGGLRGYFPQVYSPVHDRQWLLSETVGASALGFAQRSDRSIYWSTLDDLEHFRLGVVQDEVNTERLDQKIEQGSIKAEKLPDEVALLKRLGHGPLDLAAIDSLVFAHLINNDARLSSLRGQLVMNPRILEQRSLHVAFRRDAEGRRLAALLAEGLKRIGFTAPVITSFTQ